MVFPSSSKPSFSIQILGLLPRYPHDFVTDPDFPAAEFAPFFFVIVSNEVKIRFRISLENRR
jgi:hypothetical protein